MRIFVIYTHHTMLLVRRIRWVGRVARMGDKNAYNIFARKPDGKRPLARP